MNPCWKSRRHFHRLVGAVAAGAALGAGKARGAQPESRPPFKVLHVMSYHSPWRWTDGQLRGFQEGMGDLPAQYQVFQLDAKHHNTPQQLERRGAQAREQIESWKPDLVYTSDDEAQQYVARHYVDRELPFVFSGVNRDPQVYGFVGSRNITGVREEVHFLQSVRLLQGLVPGIQRLAVVFDDAPIWEITKKLMKEQMALLPDMRISAWDTITTFEDYKRRVRAYQRSADAIALVGIFNFKDEQGRNVPYQQVLRWTAEHSRLPDLGYWIDRVHHGTLAAVTVSEREQGLAAGRIAREILAQGRRPDSFPMRPTTRGTPVISLARAERLGIKVKSSLLLSAEVIRTFEWEK